MAETIVLLHGFAGTGRSWDPVIAELDAERYRAVTPALQDADTLELPDRFVLCGYSMGGRVALQLALDEPSRVSRLVLVSATAGIADAAERDARREADEALAQRIEEIGIAAFADEWMAHPLFEGTSDAARALWREDLTRSDAAGVAAQLRRFGQGVMKPVWDRLGELTMPAVVVVGERDAKYAALGRRLVEGLPNADLIVIRGAGHGLPREAPAPLAAILASDDA